jgi:hypothetical protein
MYAGMDAYTHVVLTNRSVAESSLRNVVFSIKDSTTDNAQHCDRSIEPK